MDEYNDEYDWDRFEKEFINFNGGISGVIEKVKNTIDKHNKFYDPHMPEYLPISHCSGPDCTYNFGSYAGDYFKDPDGYEFTSHEFS